MNHTATNADAEGLSALERGVGRLHPKRADHVPPTSLALSNWCITCKCGHMAPIDLFTELASGERLPQYTYQCRACGVAWQVRKVADGWRAPSGYWVPATWACVTGAISLREVRGHLQAAFHEPPNPKLTRDA